MADRRSDVQVGLFAVIGVILLMMIIFVFGGFKNVFAHTYTVIGAFDNAAGATEGTPVRLLGIEIGRVKNIVLAPDKSGVLMRLEIRHNVEVSADAPLSIRQEGFIANTYLEFGAGSGTAALTKDGKAVVKGKIETFASYLEVAATTLAAKSGEIGAKVADVSQRLATLVDSLNALAGDEKFRNDVKELTLGARDVANQLKEKLPSLMDNLNAAASGAQGSIDKASKLFDTYQALGQDLTETNAVFKEQVVKQGANLDELSASLTQAAQDVAKLSESLNEVAGAVKAGQGSVGKAFVDPGLYDSMVTLIDNLSRASAEYELLAKTLREHPDWLLKGPPKKKQ